MKKFLACTFLLVSGLFLSAFAPGYMQAPKFTKYDIKDSGCRIYLPGKPDPVDMSYSPDSSKVYTIESLDSTYGTYFHFGTIVVRLKEGDLVGTEEDMLTGYMDYLKDAFKIKKAVGYGKGHALSTHPTAKGVIDFWEDEDGDQWSVAGWAAESTIFVMFIYGNKEFPNQSVKEVFFKGARFPGD
ncbi:MAG: hypothetical protein FD123_1953 [Bacteroidetes bacterium]|nr:MAG: hypothetical protein FD123_1953 [Bacteroidota bacterium]